MLVSELFEGESLTDLISELDSLKRKMKQPGVGDSLEFSYKFNNLMRLIRNQYGHSAFNKVRHRYNTTPDTNPPKTKSLSRNQNIDDKKPIDTSISYSKIYPFQDKIARIKARLMKKNLPFDVFKDLNTALMNEYNRAKETLSISEYEILNKNINDYFTNHIPLPDYSSKK